MRHETGTFFLGDTIDEALELLNRGAEPKEVIDGRW
jgi:hypothetical protein